MSRRLPRRAEAPRNGPRTASASPSPPVRPDRADRPDRINRPERPDPVDRPARRPRPVRPVRLGRRSVVALGLVTLVGIVAFGWPLLAPGGSGLAHDADAPWLFAALLPLLLAVVVAEISGSGGLDAKSVAMLGVLAAAGAALRPLGAGTAGLEPMFFLMVLAGRVLGPGFGFVLGAVTMFASALLTGGVGPWLPFQMLAMGWVCVGAGLLPRPHALRGVRERLLLAAYGVVAALLYGLVMNLQGWPYLGGMASGVSFVPGDALGANLSRFLAYDAATSLGWDVPRAALTAVLVLVVGSPLLRALRRATRRAAFAAEARFTGAAPPARGTGPGRDTAGGPGADGGGTGDGARDGADADGAAAALHVHGAPAGRGGTPPDAAPGTGEPA